MTEDGRDEGFPRRVLGAAVFGSVFMAVVICVLIAAVLGILYVMLTVFSLGPNEG